MAKTSTSPVAPTRLWVKAAFTGFRRSKHTQNSNQALLKLQNVNTKEDVAFYQGKRVVYIYKGQKKNGSNYRVIKKYFIDKKLNSLETIHKIFQSKPSSKDSPL